MADDSEQRRDPALDQAAEQFEQDYGGDERGAGGSTGSAQCGWGG
ncbi:hypothetical protein [Glutamicibacter sp. NPDC087344]